MSLTMLYPLKGSHSVQPTLNGIGNYVPFSLGEYIYVSYLEFFCKGDFSLLQHLLIDPVIHLHY